MLNDYIEYEKKKTYQWREDFLSLRFEPWEREYRKTATGRDVPWHVSTTPTNFAPQKLSYTQEQSRADGTGLFFTLYSGLSSLISINIYCQTSLYLTISTFRNIVFIKQFIDIGVRLFLNIFVLFGFFYIFFCTGNSCLQFTGGAKFFHPILIS